MIAAALLLAAAQTTAAPAPAAPTATAPAARLNLDTPVETIMADAKGKAVIDAAIPQLAGHPSYDMFKGMSLNQLQGYAPEQLSNEVLAKVATGLAAIK